MPRTLFLLNNLRCSRIVQSKPLHTFPSLLLSSHLKNNSPQQPFTSGRFYLTEAVRKHQAKKMAPQLDGFFAQVDTLADSFIERLRKAVAIPSISAEDARRPDVVRMGHWLADELKGLGAEVELRPLGKQPHKEHLDLPPVVVARYGNDKAKRTILVYGHYDVQPAEKSDGWATEPFDLTVDEKGRMFGRGATDDKGPVLGWLNAIEAHQKAGIDFPVNLLMCFEGMEEYGSEGLDDFIISEKDKYFKDADAVCISDNYWLGTEKPCLTYGLRGCNYYSIEVSGPGADLHSGVFGGQTHEPMTDLVQVMSTLVDAKGNIQIPGIMEQVAPVTEDEDKLYDTIAFTMDNIHESLGSTTTIHDSTKPTLMARWRYPSLSLHGIEGAFSAPGAKTVIPAKVTGKFSIRTVPNMDIETTNAVVIKHIESEFAKINTKNTLKVWPQHCGKWWVASPKHWNFSAAAKAVQRVWNVEPDFTREGGRYVEFLSDIDEELNADRTPIVSPLLLLSKKLLARMCCFSLWEARPTEPTPSTRSLISATTLRALSSLVPTCIMPLRSPKSKQRVNDVHIVVKIKAWTNVKQELLPCKPRLTFDRCGGAPPVKKGSDLRRGCGDRWRWPKCRVTTDHETCVHSSYDCHHPPILPFCQKSVIMASHPS